MTPIDTAHAAMEASANDDAARLRFFERVADSELFLLLDAEPSGDDIVPRLFQTGQGGYVLAFDREDRLAGFAGGPASYAALPGRAIAVMLDGQDIGLGLNLDVAPSSILIPPMALTWLATTLGAPLEEDSAAAAEFTSPSDLPHRLIESLDTKLASAGGLARMAYMTGVTYRDGRRGHLLALIDPLPGAQHALARAVSEALIFSGLDAGELDVTFLGSSDPAVARLARTGLRFDLPDPTPNEPGAPGAPGMDPNRPPRLR